MKEQILSCKSSSHLSIHTISIVNVKSNINICIIKRLGKLHNQEKNQGEVMAFWSIFYGG